MIRTDKLKFEEFPTAKDIFDNLPEKALRLISVNSFFNHKEGYVFCDVTYEASIVKHLRNFTNTRIGTYCTVSIKDIQDIITELEDLHSRIRE